MCRSRRPKPRPRWRGRRSLPRTRGGPRLAPSLVLHPPTASSPPSWLFEASEISFGVGGRTPAFTRAWPMPFSTPGSWLRRFTNMERPCGWTAPSWRHIETSPTPFWTAASERPRSNGFGGRWASRRGTRCCGPHCAPLCAKASAIHSCPYLFRLSRSSRVVARPPIRTPTTFAAPDILLPARGPSGRRRTAGRGGRSSLHRSHRFLAAGGPRAAWPAGRVKPGADSHGVFRAKRKVRARARNLRAKSLRGAGFR